LENIYYFPSCSGEAISLHHSFTLSLLHSFISFTPSLLHSFTSSLLQSRAELGRYLLSINIKASIFSYWQRLKHSTNNVLSREEFQYATKHTTFFDIQQNEAINKKCKIKEPATQQHIKNARLVIKKTLKNQYLQSWLETQNRSSTSSREKFTQKKVKNNYQFENYLTLITKPAHRISPTMQGLD